MDVICIIAVITNYCLTIFCIATVTRSKSKAIQIFAEIEDESVRQIMNTISKVSIKEITCDSQSDLAVPRASKLKEEVNLERLNKKRKCLQASE